MTRLDYSNNHRLPDRGELALEHGKDTLQEVVEHNKRAEPHKQASGRRQTR